MAASESIFRQASDQMIGANQKHSDNEWSPTTSFVIVAENLHIIRAMAAASSPNPGHAQSAMAAKSPMKPTTDEH
ncbi:hypothetical protein ACLOJK_040485 [Asimina triloba]